MGRTVYVIYLDLAININILQPQKLLLQSLYWRLHSTLPWSRTGRFSFVSIVAIRVCRFLSSVVKAFFATVDPIEVEECQCQSIKVRRLVKSLGNKLHSCTCVFKASSCSPRSTRTGRLLRHVFTLKQERKSVSMTVLGSAKILLARSVLELLGWASNERHVLPLSLVSGGSWKELSTTVTTDFFWTGNWVVYNWSRRKTVSQFACLFPWARCFFSISAWALTLI